MTSEPTPSDRQLAEEIWYRVFGTHADGETPLKHDVLSIIARHVASVTAEKDAEIYNLRALLSEAVREIDAAYERARFVRAATSEQRLRFEAAINAEPVT